MKKTELYEIIKLKKPEPVHKTDEFLRGKCHDVLRLITKVSPLFWGYGFKFFYY
jgi:hypothetical protein